VGLGLIKIDNISIYIFDILPFNILDSDKNVVLELDSFVRMEQCAWGQSYSHSIYNNTEVLIG
jgi:hypothetical protein